jgi:hypothetical protein
MGWSKPHPTLPLPYAIPKNLILINRISNISRKFLGGNENGKKIFKYYVYTLADPREPENIRYIGLTVNPKHRLTNHCRRQRGKSRYLKWKNKIIKDGVKPIMKIIGGTNTDLFPINIIEVAYIKLYRSLGFDLVNTSAGGGRGAIKYKTDEERREARRKAQQKKDQRNHKNAEYRARKKERDKIRRQSEKWKSYEAERRKTPERQQYQQDARLKRKLNAETTDSA